MFVHSIGLSYIRDRGDLSNSNVVVFLSVTQKNHKTEMLTLIHVVLSFTILDVIRSKVFTIQTHQSGPLISDEFLSVTIDASLASHWDAVDFDSIKLNTLAKGLSPLYFRYGGTSQDQTSYDTSGTITSKKIHVHPNIDANSNSTSEKATRSIDYNVNTQILNMSEFSTLTTFSLNNNWKFVFGLNAQQRFSTNNSWNQTQTSLLIDKLITSEINSNTNKLYAFELANEPDSYKFETKKDNFVYISPKQLARDYYTLYKLIYTKFMLSLNNVNTFNYKPNIFGCDVSHSPVFLDAFVQELKTIEIQNNMRNSINQTTILNGITWHHYYVNSDTATFADFISIPVLDSLIPELNLSMSIGRGYDPNIPVILGETSSCWNGGAKNLSSSFVAGFMWLDKLGLSAGFGLYSVMRQEFIGGNYGLINKTTYQVNPDYYTSYLFKNLIGNRVLVVENQFKFDREIRVYAFCTKTKEQGSVYSYINNGSVTLIILNLKNETSEISIAMDANGSGSTVDKNYDDTMDLFMLTPFEGVLNSQLIFLNGKVIQMTDNTTLPYLEPLRVNQETIKIQSLSYAFVVLVNANQTMCISSR